MILTKTDKELRRLQQRRDWQNNNKERVSENRKKWLIKNREKVNKQKNDRDKFIKENLPEKHKEILVKKKYYSKRFLYKMDAAQFDNMITEQKNSCAICKRKSGEGRRNCLCVDHDHITGKTRGLLCQNCNRGLGLLKDNLEILKSAIKYLKENKK